MTSNWTEQNNILKGHQENLKSTRADLKLARAALAKATMECQIDAYNTYRNSLEDRMKTRLDDLKTIKELLEAAVTPAPGTEGARCEKALSNGTFRPQRGEMTCGGEESGLCCGASRVWMDAGVTKDGVAVENAMWRTIESCQLATAETYDYQPPRAPM